MSSVDIPQAIASVEAALAAEREAREYHADWKVKQVTLLEVVKNHVPTLLAALEEKDAEMERLRKLCGDVVDFVRFSKVESVMIENADGEREVFVDDLVMELIEAAALEGKQ